MGGGAGDNDGDEFDYGRNASSTLVPVRMIIAKQSRRRFAIVRGSRSRSRSRSSRGGWNAGTEYLVTLGSPAPTMVTDVGTPMAIPGRWGYHCSCRSFFEKLKVDPFALCKHLLAARLAPYLCPVTHTGRDGSSGSDSGPCIYQEEEVEEEEFADIYTRLSLASLYS